jgi:hypothetical protein
MNHPSPSADDEEFFVVPVHAAPEHTTTVRGFPGTFYRALPPGVRQSGSETCWAAAVASWLVVNPAHTVVPVTQAELITGHQTTTSGGLSLAGFYDLAAFYSIDTEIRIATLLSNSYLYEKLRDHGHVLVSYNLGNPTNPLSSSFSHMHVVYGIGYPDGKELQVSVMDPNTGTHKNLDHGFYRRKTGNVLVGWPKNLRGGAAP